MKGERTKEDREHVDGEPTKNKELKELMPDETRAVDRTDKKTPTRRPEPKRTRSMPKSRK